MHQGDDASARLRRLAGPLPAIEGEGFIPATFPAPQGQMPYARFADELEELHRLVYADDWVRYDLGWPTWMASSEARVLLADPAAMSAATPEQLARVLSVIVRLERFSDGTMAGAVRSGRVAGATPAAGCGPGGGDGGSIGGRRYEVARGFRRVGSGGAPSNTFELEADASAVFAPTRRTKVGSDHASPRRPVSRLGCATARIALSEDGNGGRHPCPRVVQCHT